MGTTLAVMLANISTKSKRNVKEENYISESGMEENPSEKRPDCSRNLVWNCVGVECQRWRNCFHVYCFKNKNSSEILYESVVTATNY